jgi:hypothetical protein
MERLSLDKFQDVKLEDKQLSFIQAGEGCTGVGAYYWKEASGREITFGYGSDCVGSDGKTLYFDTVTTIFSPD